MDFVIITGFMLIGVLAFFVGRSVKSKEVHKHYHTHNHPPETEKQTRIRMQREAYAICMNYSGRYPTLCEDLMDVSTKTTLWNYDPMGGK